MPQQPVPFRAVAPRQHPAHTERQPMRHKLIRQFRTTRKIVQNPPRRRPVLLEHLQHLVERAPAMQIHRQPQPLRRLQLHHKHRQLPVQRKRHRLRIQANLTNRHRTLRRIRQTRQRRHRRIIAIPRMHPLRKHHFRILRRQPRQPVPILRMDRRRNQTTHPRPPRTGKHFVQTPGKHVAVQMAMYIN